MTKQPKRARPAAQSAEAAEKAKAAKEAPPEKADKAEPKGKAAKEPKSEHDQLAEIRSSFVKIAKVEQRIEDLKSSMKAERERLKTLNREHRFLLQGQGALPFAGKREELDTTSEWFDVVEVGTNRFVAKLQVGDPHLGDYRKKPKDFIVRPGTPPAAGDLQEQANRERADWAAGRKGPRPIDGETDNKSKAAGEGLRPDAAAE